MSPVIPSPAYAQIPDYCFISPGLYFHLRAYVCFSFLNSSVLKEERAWSINSAHSSAADWRECAAVPALTTNHLQPRTSALMASQK